MTDEEMRVIRNILLTERNRSLSFLSLKTFRSIYPYLRDFALFKTH